MLDVGKSVQNLLVRLSALSLRVSFILVGLNVSVFAFSSFHNTSIPEATSAARTANHSISPGVRTRALTFLSTAPAEER